VRVFVHAFSLPRARLSRRLEQASSRVKSKSFYRKSELHMFLLISGGHIGGQNIASPYNVSTKVREMFRQITQKLWATKT